MHLKSIALLGAILVNSVIYAQPVLVSQEGDEAMFREWEKPSVRTNSAGASL